MKNCIIMKMNNSHTNKAYRFSEKSKLQKSTEWYYLYTILHIV